MTRSLADEPAAAALRPTVKTRTALADGRDLFYFDEPDTHADRAGAIDRRPLPASDPTSIMRHDRLLDEWVTIASHRQTRTYLPPDDECPLCPSSYGHAAGERDRLSEIPATDYDVAVFENRFPSFALPSRRTDSIDRIHRIDGIDDVDGFVGDPFSATAPGTGRCEVVCFTADHNAAFSSLTPARTRTVIDAWVDRTEQLSLVPQIEQVFCFENRGEEIGVTLRHPHGQIYGYPYVTPRTRRMLDSARTYRDTTGGNLFVDIVAEETASDRVVVQSPHWIAFVPFAARWPVEVHLYPRRQVPDLPALDAAERLDLSHVYLEVLRRMEAVHPPDPPYIAAWHQAPVRVDRDLGYLHLELFSIRRAPGKLKYLAGSESAMGAFINDVQPEDVANSMRTAMPDLGDIERDRAELGSAR